VTSRPSDRDRGWLYGHGLRRTALRLGAQVGAVYRRAQEDMVVLPGELEELLEEGGTGNELRAAPLSWRSG